MTMTRLGEVMTPHPIVLNEDDRFSLVEEHFRKHHIRHLPVVDGSWTLKGIITQRDLYRISPPRQAMDGSLVYDRSELDRFILKHVMTRDLYTLHPTDTVKKAIDAMVRKKYGCIPIVDERRKLVGIVTQIDLLRAMAD